MPGPIIPSLGDPFAGICGPGGTQAGAPRNTVPPVINGTAVSGQTLGSGSGQWAGAQPITLTYQWYSGDTASAPFFPVGEGLLYDAESGATANTYLLDAGDVGRYLFCVVTATNAQGNASEASTNLGPVTA